jgi:crossover junction endodeoxyribonuclease RuvC
MAVGQARGVVLLAAAQHAVAVRESTPNEVKSAVAGYGSADKEQVGRMVAVILGLDAVPAPDDAADALAIAICTANREPRIVASTATGADVGSATRDRAAVPPIERRRPTGYELAVHEALARERARTAR